MASGPPTVISNELVREVADRLAAGLRVRRRLPGGGVLSIDRPLPFLLVHRKSSAGPAGGDRGTDTLVSSEASFLKAPAGRKHHASLAKLVTVVAEEAAKQFGAFLLIEVWAAAPKAGDESLSIEQPPAFRILHPKEEDPGALADYLEERLAQVKVRRMRAHVAIAGVTRCAPRRLPELLTREQRAAHPFTLLGLEVLPIYRSQDGEELFAPLLRGFRRSLSRPLRRTFYEFTRTRTSQRPAHFHVLGRRSIVKAVWEVDGRLAQVADAFDFLLLVTPANSQAAWHDFRRTGYEREPTLHYRHLPVDPAALKRKLYQIPVERIEDPALAQIFRQSQDELDRQITMLGDRNTPRFLLGSAALYGPVDDTLVETARELLRRVPARSREGARGETLDAETFAERARREIEYYEAQWREVRTTVEVRTDMASGLMVSRGRLLVGEDSRIPASRVEALLQHEVGTHVLTYFNGRAQPFQQLRSGLAGYEPLQEGLAVLAEYLVGGLSRPRLRLLAGRVLAADALLNGASFVDTFRTLTDDHGFERRTAFTMTLRIHRGGGLTKDAFYLKGLIDVLAYLGRGGRLRPLLVGKMAFEHVPIIRELQWRKVLRDPPLTPRYLDLPGVAARLESIRDGATVFDLIERKRK